VLAIEIGEDIGREANRDQCFITLGALQCNFAAV
jgi:hypothetical protein